MLYNLFTVFVSFTIILAIMSAGLIIQTIFEKIKEHCNKLYYANVESSFMTEEETLQMYDRMKKRGEEKNDRI